MRSPAITRTPTPMETPCAALLTMDSSMLMELVTQVLEVEVRVIAPLRKRFTQVVLQILPGDPEARCENGLGELHNFRLAEYGRRPT